MSEQDEALAAMQKLFPGQGAWTDWSVLDAMERRVGILEHVGRGPASRLLMGCSRKSWAEAIERAQEKAAGWDKPKEKKPKEPDPNELPQEELPIDLSGAKQAIADDVAQNLHRKGPRHDPPGA